MNGLYNNFHVDANFAPDFTENNPQLRVHFENIFPHHVQIRSGAPDMGFNNLSVLNLVTVSSGG